jgi:hypothetical protein
MLATGGSRFNQLNDQPSTQRHLMMRGRLFMGATSSPYQTVQGLWHAKELIFGDPTDSQNVFHWHRVRMNLPGALAMVRPWHGCPRFGRMGVLQQTCSYI